jgi:hypothetical protein
MSAGKLHIGDLMHLEEYAEARPHFRRRVLEHKRRRTVHLGPHLTLLFEDRLTIQYQVQEMLRIERIYERAAIQEELDAYNPLVPDGSNWKATCLIEYEDAAERRLALARLRQIERGLYATLGDAPRVMAVADEDLEREDAEHTAAVHFLRFELPKAAVAALRGGGALRFGVDHPHYRYEIEMPPDVREALLEDLLSA